MILMCAGLFTAGCSPGSHKVYTLGEWLEEVRQQSGIDAAGSASTLDALKDFGVLESTDIDTEQKLNREWTAYTLVNLSGISFQEAEVADIAKTQFPQHVKTGVKEGLFTLDGKKKFHPKRSVEEAEAMKLLGKTISYINDPHFETKQEINVAQDAPVLRQKPLAFDAGTLTCLLPAGTDLKQYQAISWVDDAGQEVIYDIDHSEETEEGISVQLKEADLLSYTDSMELSGESGLDFENAEIITGEKSAAVKDGAPFIHTMAAGKTKKFSVHGYDITLTANSAGIEAKMEKELDNSLNLTGSLKMSGINVKYRFFSLKKDVRDAYFKVDLHSEEALKIKAGRYKKLYGDFSKIDPKNFLSSLSGFLKPVNENATAEFTICQMNIPLSAAAGIMSVKAKLSVVLYASGRASLVLSQDNNVGFEVRKGSQARFIRDYRHKEENVLKADTAITGKLAFALEALKVSIMDIGVEAGAKAVLSTSVHLYDKEGNMETVSTDLPSDAVNELSDGNPDVLVCTDMDAYTILKLKFNSGGTLAGKMGFAFDISLLDKSNGSILGGTKHFENWHMVDACTRKKREKKVETAEVPKTEKIRIASYAIAVGVGESKAIQITGLPGDIRAKDLVYSCGSSCASVSASGLVTGISPGAAIVTIASRDGRYSIECSILVTGGKAA